MKTVITRIYRLTPMTYRQEMACGHRETVPTADLKGRQLFVGKAVTCDQCQKQHTVL